MKTHSAHPLSSAMSTIFTTNVLIAINFLIISFFAAIGLINYYHIDYTIVGVFRELLTIPFLVGQLLFLVIGIIHLFKNEKSPLLIVSLILVATSTVLTIGSFFVN